MSLAGVRSDTKIDGVSFSPLLKTSAPGTERPLFWHYPHYSNQLGKPASAVRKGEFKLIRFYEDDHLELYHLKEDPGETKDVSATLSTKASELASILNEWLADVKAEMPTPNPKYDPKRESEGYWWKEPNAYERWKTQ